MIESKTSSRFAPHATPSCTGERIELRGFDLRQAEFAERIGVGQATSPQLNAGQKSRVFSFSTGLPGCMERLSSGFLTGIDK
jgi:hypothetical protein